MAKGVKVDGWVVHATRELKRPGVAWNRGAYSSVSESQDVGVRGAIHTRWVARMWNLGRSERASTRSGGVSNASASTASTMVAMGESHTTAWAVRRDAVNHAMPTHMVPGSGTGALGFSTNR
jgi:hypothetical protein